MSYKNLPNKIKVGYKDYEVTLYDSVDVSQKGNFGHADHMRGEIKVMPGLSNTELANTVYHELVHCVFWCFNIPNGEGNDRINHMDEERVASSLANGMMAVYRDNPKLHKFYQECLK